jgi:TP901 family phage tail tape measure protein
MAAIKLDIGGDTRRLDRDIQKTVNRAYTINLKTKGDAPLGRITGKVNEFNKSLDASNARVIAFGATTGVIFGVQKAFRDLVSTTIEVQKSLKDINVILNASTEQLQKFGSELFNIAKNTGQSFQTVAQAATELSRQGLGLEETLKRTNEALILSRLSGLDAAKSVEALTAAVNSYASQAVTATEVVNKFANVDASFAVSSRDLAEALGRVGSSAAQSGINLNELIAIVTAAQQATARGGAVIGNSFKTIFTRLQRGKVVDLLEGLGINTTNETGQIKSTIQLLQDLAQVYDNLGTLQQAEVAEKVGGVFQINILKAALADLSKEYSVYDRALQVAASSSDQAIKRNEELNKTFAAQINALQQNIGQLSSSAGERLLTPIFDRTVGNLNKFLGSVNDADAQGIGATLGRGILDGLGQIIAGPGLALIGGIFIKLFSDVGKFAKDSIQVLLGLNQSSQQQQDLQKSISDILSKNPELIALMEKGTAGVNKAAEILLTNLQAQTVELQKQEQLANTLSKKLLSSGVRIREGVPVAPTSGKAAGYIPNFASDKAIEKSTAISLGASPSVRPKMSKGTINGKKFVMNNQEIEFPGVGKNGDSMVIPLYGGGEKLLTSSGFIPNFAKFKLPPEISLAEAVQRNIYTRPQLSQRFGAEAVEKALGSTQKTTKNFTYASRLIGSRLPTILTPDDDTRVASRRSKGDGPSGEDIVWNFPVRRASKGPLKESIESTFGSNNFIDKWIESNLLGLSTEIATAMGIIPPKPSKFSELQNSKGFKGAISATLGAIFDSAVTSSLNIASQKDGGDFDVRGGNDIKKSISKLFGENALSLGKSGQWLGDVKISAGSDSIDSMIRKTKNEWPEILKNKNNKTLAAAGYIPNFAAQMGKEAIKNESKAGIPKSKMYFSQEKALADANPMSLGLFNTIDEPDQESRNRAMQNQGFAAKGYIPNFAADTAPANLGSSIAAITIQLASLTFFLGDFGKKVKESQNAQIESLAETVVAQKRQLETIKQTTGESSKAFQKLNKSIIANEARIASGGGFLGKLDARFSALSTALGTLGPTIAATIANAIGKETKGQRVAGASFEAAGQAFSFAALGNLFNRTGRNVALLAGAALGAKNIFDQATTDLPELQAAADKSAQSLTQFNDASQRVIQSFEKITDLRQSGQAEKAGRLESQLLKDIASFQDPEIRQQARAAVANRDQKALASALDRGAEEQEKTNQTQASLLEIPTIVKSIQSIDSQIKNVDRFAGFPGFSGFVESEEKKKKLEERRIQEIDKLFANLNIFSGEAFAPGSAALQSFTGVQEKLTAGVSFEDIFTDLGVDSEVIKSLVAQEAALRGDLIETIKRRIAEEELIVKNSIEGSKVTDAINSAFEELRKNLNNYSKTVSEALSVQVSGRTGIESSLGVLRTQSLRSRSEIETEFGAVREGRATGLQADLSEINETFNSSVREAVGASFQSLIPILGSVIPQIENLATISQPGTQGTQERAEAAILAVRDKISELGSQFDLSRLEDLLGTSLSGTGSVGLVDDPQALVSQIKEAFKDAGVPAEKFDALEKALNDQNRTLIESKRIQEEQKLILAQQRFTENVKFLVGAIKSSFGGFEGFLKNNFIDNIEQIEDSTASLRILEGGEGDVSSIESARDLGTLVQELSRIAGRSIAPQLEGGDQSEVIQKIIRGQGLEISETIKTILDNIQGFEGSENIADAFIKTLQKTLGDTDESDIDVLSNQIARIQTTAANEIGKVDEQILNQAIKDLGIDDPKLAEDLKKAFELGFGLDETEQLLKLQLNTANSYLRRIADGIDKGVTDATEEKGAPLIPGNAGGSLPRGMRIANDKEVISKNFAKEVRQQSRYGYSGGNPVLLSGFDERKDAIFNPTMIKKMGMPPNAKGIAAGGYIPSIVRTLGGTGSNKKDLINRLINSGLSPKEAFQYATKLTQGPALSRAKYGASLSNFINFGKPLLALPGVVSRQAINSLIPGAALGKATGFALNANKIPSSLTSLLNRLGSSPSKFKKAIASAGKFLGPRAGILSAAVTASQGGLAAYRGGEERNLYLKRKQEEFTSSGFTDLGSYYSNLLRGIFDPVGLGASLIGGLTESVELSEGDLEQVFLDLFGLGDKRRQQKIDEENRKSKEQIERLKELANRGVIFGQRPSDNSIPTEVPDIKESQEDILNKNLSILSDLPEAPPFKFNLQKTQDLKIDDISNIDPKKLEEQRKRKQKLIDDNIKLNLLRWSAGTEAEFKQYDGSGEFTGVTELFGKVGRPEAGSRAELNSQLIELNDRIKANKNPRESLALARRAREIQEKIQGDTTKSEFKGKLFEGRAAQELLKTDGFRGGEVPNINEITRAITDKNGKIIGYARNLNENVKKELLPDPGLSLSLAREKLETGLGEEDIYIKNLPELRKIDNPQGLGVFNYQQEGTSRSERKAIEDEERLSKIVRKPNIGKIPNFAQDSSAANINVGPINVNLTSNLSKDSAQEYGEEFSNKLEEQIAPLLEKIKQELDQKYGRVSETVTNLLRSNNFTEFAPPPTSR